MNVSTAHGYDAALQELRERQSELSEAQLRLTTGKRVARASDDPAAAARAERALASIARIDADQRGVDASRTLMMQADSALGDANDLLQRARELLVQSGNGALRDEERQGIASELRGLRDQLLAVANRSDGASSFLFGGQGAAQPPFVDMPGGVQYRGTAGQARTAGGEPLPVALDGAATWLTARSGNGQFETSVVASGGGAWIDAGRVTDPAALTGSTYDIEFALSNGQTTYSVLKDGVPTAQAGVPYQAGKAIEVDGMAVTVNGTPSAGDAFRLAPSAPTLGVFDVLDRALAGLTANGSSQAERAQAGVFDLRDIDQVMTRLSTARAGVGSVLGRIDGVSDQLAGLKLRGESEKSSAEDLDMVQAISDFQNKQSGYDAALKSYSMVQRLSLFEYLRG